jgi:phosphate transport system substrate-binding protein
VGADDAGRHPAGRRPVLAVLEYLLSIHDRQTLVGRDAVLAGALVLVLVWSACRRAPNESTPDARPASQPLEGRITAGGSSTVLPIARILADRFQKAHPGVAIDLTSSNTGDALGKLCAGQLDIAEASRPINSPELEQCRAHAVAFVEMAIAFDSLTVVIHPENAFVDCLTVGELRKIWEPHAEGRVRQWSDVRDGFPARPLVLFGPGPTSGTYDYFTLAIVNAQGLSRADYSKSDDDNVLANAVAADPNALSYFGSAYYRANRNRLKAVDIDNGAGCVAPSVDTVLDETYQPLARPIFLYVNAARLDRPEMLAFARFAMSTEHRGAIQEIGYVPLPAVALLAAAKRVDMRLTGSLFAGRGAVVGVTAGTFADEERVRNALVR